MKDCKRLSQGDLRRAAHILTAVGFVESWAWHNRIGLHDAHMFTRVHTHLMVSDAYWSNVSFLVLVSYCVRCQHRCRVSGHASIFPRACLYIRGCPQVFLNRQRNACTPTCSSPTAVLVSLHLSCLASFEPMSPSSFSTRSFWSSSWCHIILPTNIPVK